MKFAVSICILSVACSVTGAPVGKGQPEPDVPVFDAASSGIAIDEKSLTEAERRLLRIEIPLMEFRQANIFDMLAFLDECVAKFGEGPESNPDTRVRIVWDSTLERPLGPDKPWDVMSAPPKELFEPYLPPLYRRIPILYALKMIVEGFKVQYSVSNLDVTVKRKVETANKAQVDESKLNVLEKRMNAVVIPEIDFRQADILAIVAFLDGAVREFGTGAEKDDETRVRIRIDGVSVTDDRPIVTFACRKMPLLHAVRVTAELGGLEYRTQGNVLTLFRHKKEANKTPEDLRR